MSKYTEVQDETIIRIKAGPSTQQMEIIEGTVEAYLNNVLAVEAGRKVAADEAKNQLDVLRLALNDYAEPLTEDVYESYYRAKVSERLRSRYKSAESLQVMVNNFKVAMMGLTLAKWDKDFLASASTTNNLQKYVKEVRSKLHAAIDPDTKKPRLRAIEQKQRIKPLPKGKLYWLIGCETDQGIAGANTIVAADTDLDSLRRRAQRLAGKFKSYLYIEAPEDAPVLDISAETEKPLAIQNAAVFASAL